MRWFSRFAPFLIGGGVLIDTPFDGDTVFTASTGEGPIVEPARLLVLGDAAATCVARAIVRGVSAD